MILTCPDCATRYSVDETRFPAEGRKVRCAACGCSWRAEIEVEPLVLIPQDEPEPEPEPVAPRSTADELPKSFRAQVQAKRRTRRAVAAGVVWGGMAAAFVVLTLSALVFRVQVVQMWPRTAGAYAAVHMPVNPLGLTPDAVQAAPDLLDGHAALTVTGGVRNVDPGPRPPAPLRVSLYDRVGHRLAEKVVRLAEAPLKPGEDRPFKVSFIDPPLSGAQVGVDFVFEPRARRAPPAPSKRSEAAAPQLRARGLDLPAAAPATARPAQALPAGSPYALPAAVQVQGQAQVRTPAGVHG